MSLLSSLSSPSSSAAALYKAQSTPTAANAQQTLTNRIAERLGLQPGSLGGQASDYTPEKVAERVVGYAERALQRESAAGASPERLEYVLGQIRKGVDKGIGEAKDILDSLGVLQGKVASDIEDTYSRIQTGLDSLQKDYAQTTGASNLIQASTSQRFAAQASSFELSVTTRDGDLLRISIAQSSAAWSQSTSSSGRSEQGFLQISGLQVSVEGELDDEEKAALEKLLGQVSELSDRFFSGDLDGAFDQALALELDGEQLYSMSLQLTQTSVRLATDTYSSVAGNSGDGQAISAVNPALKEYAQGLLEALHSANSLLLNGKESLERLLSGVMSTDERFDAPALEKAEKLNSTLLQGQQSEV
ncbi:DUF5610 domain-containing protein [Pseudomonas sp. ABC1]|uniref:DUF5610 domain-containing protein n=1 Tax=Pseudomonas sp. ABC1 TaxID=2748080 RepID=UPI0015C3FB05|nr:DUF5610 domain-containing protein [Pseudomonas sp. ABC1]QLF91965.1 DUF5610 domain-containing protein [Pseudomonas sp. ABC1]